MLVFRRHWRSRLVFDWSAWLCVGRWVEEGLYNAFTDLLHAAVERYFVRRRPRYSFVMLRRLGHNTWEVSFTFVDRIVAELRV